MIIGKNIIKTSKEDINGIPTFIAFIFIFLLFILVIFWRNMIQEDLKKNGVIVNAEIIKVNVGGKVSGGFQCRFNFKGEMYEESSPSTLHSGVYDFIGKTFPAMYSRKHDALEILITPTDFEKFNIPFPDSLNWVMKYVIEK